MFAQVQGLIIKTLLDDTALAARVSDRVYPDESNLGSGLDQTFPLVVASMRQTNRLRDVEAVAVRVTIMAYSNRGRDDALRLHELAHTAVYNVRMTTSIDGVNYSGVLEELSSVEPQWDGELQKYFAQSLWEGNFVKH